MLNLQYKVEFIMFTLDIGQHLAVKYISNLDFK